MIMYILSVFNFSLFLFYQELRISQSWSGMHYFNNITRCSCTSLATNPNLPDFVSAGEDGKIVMLRIEHTKPLRTLGRKDIICFEY